MTTVNKPRTELRDAGDCGGVYHYGLCNSCGAYISVVPEAAQAPIDVVRLPDDASPEYVRGFQDGWKALSARLGEDS